MNFRKDINGLRAIAVLAVLIYHFRPDWLSGGFAGVDVFFVISGYLMTAIIMRGLENQNFSVSAFYLARAKRIVPALAVMSVFVMMVGWFYLLPSDYATLGKHAASSLGFMSNIMYWGEAGYFTTSAHEKWLLHTWSLSVEWQFYLAYPLILLLAAKVFGLKYVKHIVIIGILASFALSVYASPKWQVASFFLLPTRAWEMMLGGAAFLFPIALSVNRKKQFEFTGLALIALSYFVFTKHHIWPGYLALVPIAGTMLIIIANRQDSLVTGSRLVQSIGSASYSIYLWHWPVVVFGYYEGLIASPGFLVAGTLVSVVLGYLSLHTIERFNFKRVNRFGAKLAFTYTVVLALGLGIFYNSGIVTQLRPISVSEKAEFYTKYQRENYFSDNKHHYRAECNFFDDNTKTARENEIAPFCVESDGDGGVFLWGDSHAQALSYGLAKTLPDDIPFYQVTTSSCAPILGLTAQASGEFEIACNRSNAYALQKITELKPAVVLLAQKDKHELTGFAEIAEQLKAVGVQHVVLVGPVPQWYPSLPNAIIRRHWDRDDQRFNDPSFVSSVSLSDRLIADTYQDSKEVNMISLIDALCTDKGCLAKINNEQDLLVWDYGHLSLEGSTLVAETVIFPRIQGMLN